MKIRLKVTLPVEGKHRMIEGAIFTVVEEADITSAYRVRWWVQSHLGERIGVFPGEAEVVKEEDK